MSSPTSNSKASGFQGLAGKLLFSVVVVLFAVAATEMLFRTVIFPDWRALSPQVTIRHPIFEHFVAANLEVRRYNPPNYDVINRTNRFGFRDRNEGFETDLAGIWIGGDSNTFGNGLEDHEIFSALLEEKGFRNANIASEGRRLHQLSMVFRDLASKGHRPRAVVVVMTLDDEISDYSDAIRRFAEPLPDPEAAAPPPPRGAAEVLLNAAREALWQPDALTLMGVKTRLIKNSAIYGWLKVGINGVPALRDLTLSLGLRADLDLVYKSPTGLLRDVPDNADDALIESTADYMALLAGWVRNELHAPFGIMLLPNHHDLYLDRFQRLLAYRGLDPALHDAGRPKRKLKEALERQGIPVLDPTEALLAAETPSLTFPDDAHFNRQGHVVLAKAIAGWLETGMGIAPTP